MSCTNAQFKCTKAIVLYFSVITSSGSCSTPAGVDEHVRTGRLPVSHKESTTSSTKLVHADTGQLGPANSSRVYDRPYPDTLPIPPPSSNHTIKGQTCLGNTGSPRAAQEGGNNRDLHLLNQLHLPDIPGREKKGGGGQHPVINLISLYKWNISRWKGYTSYQTSSSSGTG